MKIKSIEQPKSGLLQQGIILLSVLGIGFLIYGALDFLLSGFESFLGLMLMILGLLLGPGMIVVGVFLEKRRLAAFKARVLFQHSNILIRFKDQKRRKEVVFIPEGLFIAEYFYPFDGANMRLGRQGLKLEKRILEIHVEGFSGMKTHGRIIKVRPPKNMEVLPKALDLLNQKYLNLYSINEET